MSRRLLPSSSRRRTFALAAATAVGALLPLGVPASAASASASAVSAGSVATAGVSAGSALAVRPAASTPVAIPSTCRAAATVVRPDTTLSMGVVQGGSGKLYSTGLKLGYTPKAIAYLGTATNRGITIDRFFAVHPSGDLRRLAITERPKTGGGFSVSLDEATVGRGWGAMRTMVSSGPYLYGITTGGALNRYSVTPTYGVTAAGTVSTKGWGGIRSLGYGGWWTMPGGKRAEDLVALTRTGEVKAYVVPRDKPSALTAHTLKAGGWGMFTHLAVGECKTGKGRVLAGVKANGDVHAYLDTNADDQSGADIKAGPRVARGWTGLVAD